MAEAGPGPSMAMALALALALALLRFDADGMRKCGMEDADGDVDGAHDGELAEQRLMMNDDAPARVGHAQIHKRSCTVDKYTVPTWNTTGAKIFCDL